MLRNPEFSSICLMNVNAVSQSKSYFTHALLVSLKSRQILIPTGILLDGKLGKLHLEFDELDVV